MPSILSIDDADESQVPALDSNGPVGTSPEHSWLVWCLELNRPGYSGDSFVWVMPIHACITAAAYDDFNIIENGVINEKWERVNGW